MLEFNYVYKIIELTTGREYIGRHKTYDLNDNYMGSGTAITAAYERNPSNFVKAILWFCNSQDEAIELEGALVDKHYIKRNYPEHTFNMATGVLVDDYTKFRWIKRLYPNTELGFVLPTGTGKSTSTYKKGTNRRRVGFKSVRDELNLTNAQRMKLKRCLTKDGLDWKTFNSNQDNINQAKIYLKMV